MTHPDPYQDTGHRHRHCLDCGLAWADVRPRRLAAVCPGEGHEEGCERCMAPGYDDVHRGQNKLIPNSS